VEAAEGILTAYREAGVKRREADELKKKEMVEEEEDMFA
jgi:hypothetical protein